MTRKISLAKCIFCQEIESIKLKKFDPYFVIELGTGYVSLSHNQYYKGYCLFISKVHASHLHQFDDEFKKHFLIEMAMVEEVINRAFKPRKMNMEALGNSVSHFHWHILPRYKNDPLPKIPVWNNPIFLKNKIRPDMAELELLKKKLLKEFRLELAGKRL